MSKIEVDAIVPQSGTTLTVGESGDTITVPSGATFDASNATTTLPATVVTTTGTQTLTNKTIDASQLSGTITPSDGTVTTAKLADSSVSLAKLTATGTKDATTFLRGDNTFAEAGGGANTPFFFGRQNGYQTPITRATWTKLTSFTLNEIDTASAFDGTTFTVPSGQAGKYFITACIVADFSAAGDDGEEMSFQFYKNGSATSFYSQNVLGPTVRNAINWSHTLSATMDLSVGDYVEVYIYLRDGTPSGTLRTQANYSLFQGFKLVE